MIATLMRLLPYLLPPILGALIGYVTNFIAIRMLFRPLTEKRLFGLRIPFTPGIIPRQRFQLSRSIASMVSTKLLTADAVKSKLNDPAFADNLAASVARFTSDLLDKMPDADEDERNAPGELSDLLSTLIEGFLSSDTFRVSARSILLAAVDGALSLRVQQIVPRGAVIHQLIGRGLHVLTDGGVAKAIRIAVTKWVTAHVANDTPLHEAIGPQALERLADLLPKSYGPILDSLVTFLHRPETRRELAIHGRALMKRILERLNVFQRLIVSATQYDRNIDENMPAIVSDVIDSFEKAGRNPDNMAEIIGVFRSKLAAWGETGVGTLEESLSISLADLAERVVTSGLRMLDREDVQERVSASVLDLLERRGTDSAAEVISDLVGMEKSELRERAVAIVDGWMDRTDAWARIVEQVSRIASGYLLRASTKTIRDTIDLSDRQKRRIDTFLAGKLREQLELRVPELIDGLDIYGMVVEKVDSLDVEGVEQLILMVISKHLKWINLFGALLGSIIGGLQVLLSRLT